MSAEPESKVTPQRPPKGLALSAIAIVVGSATGVLVPWACGSGQRHDDLPRAVQCRLDALKVLPQDIGNITVYDAIDIYERVRACDKPPVPDDAEAP